MATFEVHGPFEIPSKKKNGGGRALVFDGFWAEDAPAGYIGQERGCYVFAIRASTGLQPIYVGKATRTFKQEAFNATNRYKYHDGFGDYAKGTPLMYFVISPGRAKAHTKYIGEIEDFLIQAGVAKNPYIQNVRGAQEPKWNKGVIRNGGGRRSGPAGDFTKLFDIGH
jgi:hypothetical protein